MKCFSSRIIILAFIVFLLVLFLILRFLIFLAKLSETNILKETFDNVFSEEIPNISESTESKTNISESTKLTKNDSFPRTDQLGYVQYLVKYLKDVVDTKGDSISHLKESIIKLEKEFKRVISNFSKIPKRCRLMPDFSNVMTSIASLAYQAEYVIDLVLTGECSSAAFTAQALSDLIFDLWKKSKLVHMASGDEESFRSDYSDLLFGIPRDLLVIPLVKTDNARQVVSSICSTEFSEIVFHHRPWCTVPDDFNETKSLRLSGLTGVPDCLLDVDECLELFRTLLRDQSYLLVLWDVRDSQVLLEILAALPDDNNGSRVVVVTPVHELALLIRRYANIYLLLKTLRVQPSSSESAETAKVKPSVNGDIVGFKDVEKDVLHQILGGRDPQLQIVSIFGMAGQGKTSLANKLFNHPSISDYFDIRAWGHVSQLYQKRRLLLELLNSPALAAKAFKEPNEKSTSYDSEDLADRLYKSLKRLRFLIVMDDMWDITPWNDLKRYLPDNKNGSCIIFTTRIGELATQARPDRRDITLSLRLRPLSNDECWELLEKRVFQKEKCPAELEVVGRKIAKSCDGLPLSVVLASGLLLRTDKKADVWEKIAGSLSSQILDYPEAQCSHILEFSYKHLPDSLKPCFLYLGAFLADRAISATKVIRIWIAEGFVNCAHLEGDPQLERSGIQSLEDIAEAYLMELIHRSLVLTANEKSKRGIKACRVHDLLRSFCIMKAKEENFMQQTSKYDEEFSSFEEFHAGEDSNYLTYQNFYSYDSSPKIRRHDIRRLCVYAEGNQFHKSNPSIVGVRSLLLFSTSDIEPRNFSSFKLLKILDLEYINVGDILCQIDIPVLLRYLSFQTDANVIPPSIAKLWNLETLVVKGIGSVVVKVPDFIWDMGKLRHLDISSCSFDLEADRYEGRCSQENLQTLSTPFLEYGDSVQKLIKMLGNIRKLDCTFLDLWDDAMKCNRFPALESLSQLESLKVVYGGKGKYPCQLNFPSNLKKLTLSNFCMPWKHFSQFAQLEFLEVLKLLCRTFEGEVWEMGDKDVFGKLRFLKLDTLDLVTWHASSSTNPFPYLEHLVLHNCEQLDKIPVEVLSDIDTLKKIEVVWCNSSVAKSVRDIQQEQRESCNEDFKVHIYPRDRDDVLSSQNGDT